MNIIIKIFIVVISVSIFSTVLCKPKEKIQFKHTLIPDKMFGINFCKLQLIDIIVSLQNNKKNFKCYDTSIDNEVKYHGKQQELERITGIVSNFFIGAGFDNSKIIDVWYTNIPFETGFSISLKFKEDYYNALLKLLNKQLGENNSNINFDKYDEISWNANPDRSVPTCISSIILSKRLKYDDPAKAEKGVCYLVINTRARNPHVH